MHPREFPPIHLSISPRRLRSHGQHIRQPIFPFNENMLRSPAYMVAICLISLFPGGLWLWGKYYENTQVADSPSFTSMFLFWLYTLDSYTDLLFALSIVNNSSGYVQNIFIFSLVFLIIPKIFAIVFLWYFMAYWRSFCLIENVIIKSYYYFEEIKVFITKYKYMLALYTMITGLYPTMKLVTSQLGSRPYFSLHLMKEDWILLSYARFLCTVCFEVKFPSFVRLGSIGRVLACLFEIFASPRVRFPVRD